MTEKVQKIREEVKRLKSQLLRGACSSQIAMETMCKEEAYNEVLALLDSMQEEHVSEDLEEECEKFRWNIEESCCQNDNGTYTYSSDNIEEAFKAGAKWKVENLWKPADGDDLPEIDREVIALLDNGKVGFAHRPPEYWDGKDIITGKVTRHYPKTYDKGGWNIPNVKYWLDCLLPNMEED